MVGEKGHFIRGVTGKHSSNSLKINQKYQSIEVVQKMKHKGKWQNGIKYFDVSSSLTIFEDIFAVLPLSFSMVNSAA